jgi:predicted transposase YbfD/YdcC
MYSAAVLGLGAGGRVGVYRGSPAMSQSVRIRDHFASITDPRRRKVVYPILDVLTIALCAVCAGADDFVAIAEFGHKKRAWLSQFLDLSRGVPSHDRFNAIFAAIDPAEFEKCLLSWVTALHEVSGGQVVAIDGKTLRRSYDRASAKSALHMVSAWATANHVTLGQVAVDEGSNEITAIPKLLEILEISGCLVTIDAIGCQTEVAEKIVEAKADYVLAVKGNQPTLHSGIEDFFIDHMSDQFARVEADRHEDMGRGHGREEGRSYVVCEAPAGLPDRARWKGLKAVGLALSATTRDDKLAYEARYYILSRALGAKEFAHAVRSHWLIENACHWTLDVAFGEDQCRVRKGHAAANFGILRRAALSLLKNNRDTKVGIKNKRLTAAWDDTYLEQVLFGS